MWEAFEQCFVMCAIFYVALFVESQNMVFYPSVIPLSSLLIL